MDEATWKKWEAIASRTFDKAYASVLRRVSAKPANNKVDGPRAELK